MEGSQPTSQPGNMAYGIFKVGAKATSSKERRKRRKCRKWKRKWDGMDAEEERKKN